ncbi:DMT family transporter [Desulfotomaculum nigrificans]|uniref:DMT family transporter n=1 Tax=Desulfotomaculum nigrificans TaxID=1565 RepID=UPI0001FADFFE|nr:DMT family transporter [Desulfotomaculum nigrificans]
MNKFYLGALLVIISAACFGIMPLLALTAYAGGVSVPTLLFWRFVLAALIFFAYLLVVCKRFNLTRNNLFSLFLLGGVLYTLQSSTYFSSVKFIQPSLAVLIFYTYPILVVILSFLIEKERLTKQTLASIILCISGLIMVLGTSLGEIRWPGVLLAFAAALVYSLYNILGNRVVKQLPPVVATAFVCLFASVSFSVIGLVQGGINYNFSWSVWLAVLGISFFSTIVALLTYFAGMELIGAGKASILSTMEPVVTILCSAILLHERLTLLQGMGGMAVLLGAILVVSARKPAEGEKNTEVSEKYS